MNKPKKAVQGKKLHKVPLRITDTSLRDAHQSLWATRMRTDDIMKIIDVVDNVGFYSLECWGGATFDTCLRFLRENPWERLRLIKSKAKTPLQMLLRGQNLVGYRHYADDVVDRFVALSVENGMDIFRVFDALNDTRNLEAAIRAVKKYGGHAQGTLCYTTSPVHTIEKFVAFAKEQVALGIDSICIKDMAGILSPISAERLVTALIKELNIPVQIHCHSTSGMGISAYVDAVRAGAGAIDCAVSAMAGYSSQPPVETMYAIFAETEYSANLDMEALERMNRYFTELAPDRRQDHSSQPVIDPGILIHQIPGGMISNFRSQLAAQNALDKLQSALDEVSKVRKDLGYPPLVTPMSQIVGAQAVMNVLIGERYKVVPNEVKDYVKGLYGRSPAPIDPKFVKKILGNEKPITHRPADDIEPMLPSATDGLDPKLIEREEDIISYVIYPQPAQDYFKWRALPAGQRPETPADLEVRKAKTIETPVSAGASVASPSAQAQAIPAQLLAEEDYRGIADIVGHACGLNLSEIAIRKGDVSITVTTNGATVGPVSREAVTVAVAPVTVVSPAAHTPTPDKRVEAKSQYSTTINAPIGGTFYARSGPGKPEMVTEGETVRKGAKVCILEAMKLFNEIEAPRNCKIVKALVKDGEMVHKDQPLIGIDEV